MDLSVKPCENFYQFACGNYYNQTDIKDTSDSIDNFIIISTKVLKELRFDIRKNITAKDPKAFKLLKSYHYTCMSKGV